MFGKGLGNTAWGSQKTPSSVPASARSKENMFNPQGQNKGNPFANAGQNSKNSFQNSNGSAFGGFNKFAQNKQQAQQTTDPSENQDQATHSSGLGISRQDATQMQPSKFSAGGKANPFKKTNDQNADAPKPNPFAKKTNDQNANVPKPNPFAKKTNDQNANAPKPNPFAKKNTSQGNPNVKAIPPPPDEYFQSNPDVSKLPPRVIQNATTTESNPTAAAPPPDASFISAPKEEKTPEPAPSAAAPPPDASFSSGDKEETKNKFKLNGGKFGNPMKNSQAGTTKPNPFKQNKTEDKKQEEGHETPTEEKPTKINPFKQKKAEDKKQEDGHETPTEEKPAKPAFTLKQLYQRPPKKDLPQEETETKATKEDDNKEKKVYKKTVNTYELPKEFVIKFYEMMHRLKPHIEWNEIDEELKQLAPTLK